MDTPKTYFGLSGPMLAGIIVAAVLIIGLTGYGIYLMGKTTPKVPTGTTTGPVVKTKVIDMCTPYGNVDCKYTGDTFTCQDYWNCNAEARSGGVARTLCSSSPAYQVCGNVGTAGRAALPAM